MTELFVNIPPLPLLISTPRFFFVLNNNKILYKIHIIFKTLAFFFFLIFTIINIHYLLLLSARILGRYRRDRVRDADTFPMNETYGTDDFSGFAAVVARGMTPVRVAQ